MKGTEFGKPTYDRYEDGGFTARAISKDQLRSISVSGWAQWYHKPYQCDWAEARSKAIMRRRLAKYTE